MEPTQPTPAPYTPPVAPAPMMSPPATSGMGASKILAGLAVLLIVAAGAYYMGTDRGDEVTTLPTLTPSTVALPISSPMPTGSSEPTMCTADAKLCPDGSYVSRIAPTCEFTPCPTPTSSVPADWKTYTNTKYGFEVKYPTKWSITLNTDNRTVIQFIGTNPPATSEVVTFEMRPLGQTIGDASGQWQSYTLGGRDAHLGPAPDESGDSRVAIVVNLGQSKELAIIFPGRPGPSIYDQILSTFKFTK